MYLLSLVFPHTFLHDIWHGMLTYFIVYDLSDDTRILDTETFTEMQWFVEFNIRIYVYLALGVIALSQLKQITKLLTHWQDCY